MKLFKTLSYACCHHALAVEIDQHPPWWTIETNTEGLFIHSSLAKSSHRNQPRALFNSALICPSQNHANPNQPTTINLFINQPHDQTFTLDLKSYVCICECLHAFCHHPPNSHLWQTESCWFPQRMQSYKFEVFFFTSYLKPWKEIMMIELYWKIDSNAVESSRDD